MTNKLKLKIFWFKNILGLAVDQIENNSVHPLTAYYFWPKTNTWEQLNLELSSKLWLTQNEKIKILKTASEIMNYWLLYRDVKTIKDVEKDFLKIENISFNN